MTVLSLRKSRLPGERKITLEKTELDPNKSSSLAGISPGSR